MSLNVKPLKKCMYFWVPSIACPKLTSLCINYTTNGFVPVVRKSILYIMLPVRTSSIRKSILVDSLVYFSSLHPRFASIFQSSLLSIFQAYILASRVYFSRVEINRTQAGRDTLTLGPISNSRWSNKNHYFDLLINYKKGQ